MCPSHNLSVETVLKWTEKKSVTSFFLNSKPGTTVCIRQHDRENTTAEFNTFQKTQITSFPVL